jgi:hypothetical protein
MAFLLRTLVVQLLGAVVLVTPLIVRKRADYLATAVAGGVAVLIASLFCFPKRWGGMELISLGYFIFFLCIQSLIYFLLCVLVVLVRNLREEKEVRNRV